MWFVSVHVRILTIVTRAFSPWFPSLVMPVSVLLEYRDTRRPNASEEGLPPPWLKKMKSDMGQARKTG